MKKFIICSVLFIAGLSSSVYAMEKISQEKQELNKALFKSVHEQNADKVAELLKQGADVGYKNASGLPLLSLAIGFSLGKTPNDSGMRVIELLIDYGADINENILGCVSPEISQECRGTALSSAALSGNVELVKLLLKYKADPNGKPSDDSEVKYCVPLHSAFLSHRILSVTQD